MFLNALYLYLINKYRSHCRTPACKACLPFRHSLSQIVRNFFLKALTIKKQKNGVPEVLPFVSHAMAYVKASIYLPPHGLF